MECMSVGLVGRAGMYLPVYNVQAWMVVASARASLCPCVAERLLGLRRLCALFARSLYIIPGCWPKLQGMALKTGFAISATGCRGVSRPSSRAFVPRRQAGPS